MKHSVDRFRTTHVGSLPRPKQILDLLAEREEGKVSEENWGAAVQDAVVDAVRRQVELGIDTVSDGEWSKPSFLTYITDRLTGFSPDPHPATGSPFAGSREHLDFPDFYEATAWGKPALSAARLTCTGPIAYVGQEAVATDIANIRAAVAEVGADEAFLPAISPSNVEGWHTNSYYKTDEEFVFAIAEALSAEYEAIAAAGLILQIDDPRLVTYYTLTPSADVAECRRWAQVRVAALNHALRNIPTEQIRFHTCYSIDTGPRVHDMQLRDIVDIILSVRAGAYSFETANPRHDHEWRVWQEVTLPDEAVLIPGLVTQSTVLVEHPELVADRLERYANVVGKERVIAGADCGFGTFAGSTHIPDSVGWAKIAAIADGARIASERLWG